MFNLNKGFDTRMDYILISVAVFLLIAAASLWYFCKTQIVGLALQTSLTPGDGLRSWNKPSTRLIWYRWAIEQLVTRRRLFIFVGLISGIVGIIVVIKSLASVVLSGVSMAGFLFFRR